MSRTVAIVIPTLNEAAHISGLLDQLSRVSPVLLVEIIVADGGSTDATKAIVIKHAKRDRRVTLIENPRRIQSAGLNLAIRLATPVADTIIRIDAHGHYPDMYVERIIDAFALSGAAMIATRLRTVGVSMFQRGVAFAMNSRMGTGGSIHRIGGAPRFVDHGHHAGIDRAAFVRSSGYDENFVANEDAELDVRIRKDGGRIWLATDIVVDYVPRATLTALARQYWRYGVGRCQTFRKHRERLRVRQLVPPIVTVALLASTLATAFDWRLGLLVGTYAVMLGIWSVWLAVRHRDVAALCAAPAAATMHIAWGLGFLKTSIKTSTLPMAQRESKMSPFGQFAEEHRP
jgi:succinoglycan biosynthesis protein ExoA